MNWFLIENRELRGFKSFSQVYMLRKNQKSVESKYSDSKSYYFVFPILTDCLQTLIYLKVNIIINLLQEQVEQIVDL